MLDPGPITTALLILAVILIFNLIIFVHELGHFLAGRWRGLKIDRFQIWFGKPIWSKTIGGVQYGLGWIPAGGFVSLPQMAPMEAIEGEQLDSGEPLPPISPLDKIIVAFAGPLFSFLLALVSAVILWQLGKPLEVIPTTTIGWVQADSPAAQAGLQRGDRILAINDQAVDNWNLPLDSVRMLIATSRGERIRFQIERPGVGVQEVVSEFTIPESRSIFERRKIREVGILPLSPPGPIEVSGLSDDPYAPARLAGLAAGDVVEAIDGQPVVSFHQLLEQIEQSEGETLEFTVRRGDERLTLPVQPRRPVREGGGADGDPIDFKIGALFDAPQPFVRSWHYPDPWAQCVETFRTMWMTLTTVASPDSSIGIQHLSGPVGIGRIQFLYLLMDHPLHRILGFMVLININLAILNLLPFPVLDGGHITIATMEAIARRPVNVRFLEALQMVFVFLLFGTMLYVTSKDIFDDFGVSKPQGELVFPKPEG